MNELTPFAFWCQKVMPAVLDDSLSYYECLCKLTAKLNEVINTVNSVQQSQSELENKFNELKSYVDNYFNNLDVQTEINNKLDQMVEDGTLESILGDYINKLIVTLSPGTNLQKEYGTTTLFDTSTESYMRTQLTNMSECYDSVILKIQCNWNGGVNLPENVNTQVAVMNDFKDLIHISGIKFHTNIASWVSESDINTVLTSFVNTITPFLNTIPFNYDTIWLFNEDQAILNTAYIENFVQAITTIKGSFPTKNISFPMRNAYDATRLNQSLRSLENFQSVNLYGNVSPYGKYTTITDLKRWYNSQYFTLANLKKSIPIVITETGVSSDWNALSATGIYSQKGEGAPISIMYEAFYQSELFKIVDGVYWWYYYDAMTYAKSTLLNIKNKRGVRYVY